MGKNDMGNQIPGVDPTIRRTEPKSTVTEWATNKAINYILDNKMKSWIPKLTGVASLLTLWGNTIVMLTDGNPATNPDWSMVLTATMAAVGVISARQNNVSSQDVGIRS